MFIKNLDKTAIYTPDGEVSYSDLLCNISFYSSLYKKTGKKLKVAVFFENRTEWFYAFFSSWEMEYIAVPIDYLSSADEVAYILNDAHVDVIFFSDTTKSVSEAALKKTKHRVTKFNVDTITLNTKDCVATPLADLHPDDTAVIIYTSGTTGSPKGVMLSYDNLLANIESVSYQGTSFYHAKMQTMVLLPLHHSFPLLATMLGPLYVGGSCVLCPTLNGDDIIKAFEEHDLTLFIGVPRLYEMFKKGIQAKIEKSAVGRFVFALAGIINSRKFSKMVFKAVHERFGQNLSGFVSGGAALDYSIARFFQILGFNVYEGYGMTETAPMISNPKPNQKDIGHVGFPILHTEVKIIDGEICCRGRNVMKGYYNRPEETAEVIIDGWLHTGDLGYFDKKGHLHVSGRKKEIIVLPNGKNINPTEVEQKIEGYASAINEIGVFEKDGLLCAIIYPDMDKLQNEGILNIEDYLRSEVVNKYNKDVSPYKRIARFYLTSEELPRTRLGKIRRFKLDGLTTKKQTKSPLALLKKVDQSEAYKALSSYLANETGADVGPEDHIEIDLGMDSLDKVSLLAYIKNRFGIDMSETDLLKYSYINKLAEFLQSNWNKALSKKESETDWKALITGEKSGLKIHRSGFPHMTARNLLSFYLHTVAKVEVKGLEMLPVSPFILAPNHQSNADWLVLASTLDKRTIRNTYIFAKEKHFQQKWRQWMANRTNIIVMDINKDLNESIQKTAEILKSGKNLAIFPEGTRSSDGKLGKFKKIFAILSRELNIPIVPVAINGSKDVLPATSKFVRFGKTVTLEYLKPIFPSGRSYEAISDDVRAAIEAKLEK